jgi:hypothetical protein
MCGMCQEPEVLTVREAAQRTGRSKSSIHRDIAAGRLPVVQRVPGYRGAVLLDPQQVREVYASER